MYRGTLEPKEGTEKIYTYHLESDDDRGSAQTLAR